MTGAAPEPQLPGRVSGRRWRVQEHRIELRGVSYRLRLVSFAAGWLASVDSVEGPTLGCDRSPYLAVSRALEPVGGSLVEAMSIVAGAVPGPPLAERWTIRSGVRPRRGGHEPMVSTVVRPWLRVLGIAGSLRRGSDNCGLIRAAADARWHRGRAARDGPYPALQRRSRSPWRSQERRAAQAGHR